MIDYLEEAAGQGEDLLLALERLEHAAEHIAPGEEAGVWASEGGAFLNMEPIQNAEGKTGLGRAAEGEDSLDESRMFLSGGSISESGNEVSFPLLELLQAREAELDNGLWNSSAAGRQGWPQEIRGAARLRQSLSDRLDRGEVLSPGAAGARESAEGYNVDPVQQVDQALRRDGRRYDGGFFLY